MYLQVCILTVVFTTCLHVAQQCFFIHVAFFLHLPMADHNLHNGFSTLQSKTTKEQSTNCGVKLKLLRLILFGHAAFVTYIKAPKTRIHFAAEHCFLNNSPFQRGLNICRGIIFCFQKPTHVSISEKMLFAQQMFLCSRGLKARGITNQYSPLMLSQNTFD